jgi:hypothetical protein
MQQRDTDYEQLRARLTEELEAVRMQARQQQQCQLQLDTVREELVVKCVYRSIYLRVL